jgi:hypothetical protein
MHSSGSYSGIASVHIIGAIPFIIFGLPTLLVTVFVSQSSKFIHRKKLLDASTVVPEYTPPDKLTPAEIGYLFDSRIDKTELIATLVDLELKGFIQLGNREIGGHVITKNQTTESTAALKGHEVYILNALAQQQNYALFALAHLFRFKQSVKEVLRGEGYVRSTTELIEYFVKRTALVYVFVTAPLLFLVALLSKFNIYAIFFGVITIYVALFPFFIFVALVTGALYNKIAG